MRTREEIEAEIKVCENMREQARRIGDFDAGKTWALRKYALEWALEPSEEDEPKERKLTFTVSFPQEEVDRILEAVKTLNLNNDKP